MTPEKTVERLSMYRRLLRNAQQGGRATLFSHDIAEQMGGTAAQVRRDLMAIGFAGHPRRGYDVTGLLARIGEFLDSPSGESIALVGLGSLGSAILPFLAGYYPGLKIVAAFDVDPRKTGRMIHGCRCHPVAELERVVRDKQLSVAILATPAAAAQGLADRLVACGIRGILNFSPVPLKAPPHVWVERVDIAMALEKVAYHARHPAAPEPAAAGTAPAAVVGSEN